ncbi:lipid droplet-regulating VLDL assembly factor AUP1-like isoform X2 [Glandiceps talaboti]
MSNTDIADLFDNKRLHGGGSLIVLFFYFPIGIILATLRLFIGVQVFVISCILPRFLRSAVLRVMCGVLGLVVTTEGVEYRDKDVPVLVTNHISPLDHLAVDLVYPNVMPSVWDLPGALMWALGYRDMGAKRGREVLIEKAKEHCEDSSLPLLTHPEGATANGKKGLLKFSTWPFSLDLPIQPIVIKVRRPVIGINISTLGSRWWQDVFWFFFSPVSIFNLRVLPAMTSSESDSVDEFTKKVQSLMAKELDIATTNFTSADKVEYAKKTLFKPPSHPGKSRRTQPSSSSLPTSSSSSSSPSSYQQSSSSMTSYSLPTPRTTDRLSIMTKQVKEVLPHVPDDAIRKDLSTTQCVDTTITNILENKVSFIPIDVSLKSPPGQSSSELEGATAMPSVQTQGSLPSPSATKFSADTFSRSANVRQMSFQERKEALYEAARRKYKEKHGLL